MRRTTRTVQQLRRAAIGPYCIRPKVRIVEKNGSPETAYVNGDTIVFKNPTLDAVGIPHNVILKDIVLDYQMFHAEVWHHGDRIGSVWQSSPMSPVVYATIGREDRQGMIGCKFSRKSAP